MKEKIKRFFFYYKINEYKEGSFYISLKKNIVIQKHDSEQISKTKKKKDGFVKSNLKRICFSFFVFSCLVDSNLRL